MSLKSIRESYAGLINAFAEAGVKLDESQKASLDTFIVALESKMSKQKEATVKATKKIVTEHLEKQYQKVFESIMKHQQENALIASKIQSKVQHIKESKKMARKLDNYLSLYVESVLPKKTIVDYDRMQKLETLHESLKDMLVADEDAVQLKKSQLQESFNKSKKSYETQIAKLQAQLNESMAKTQKLNDKIESFKSIELLESMTKDLPTFEARKMKKRFANATTTEIKKNFKAVLESVQNESKEDTKEEELSLEAEISKILDNEDVKENDILNNRHHNAHISEGEDKDEKEPKKKEDCEDCEENEETYETMESYKYDKNGEIVLEGEDIIDADYMKRLCAIAESIK